MDAGQPARGAIPVGKNPPRAPALPRLPWRGSDTRIIARVPRQRGEKNRAEFRAQRDTEAGGFHVTQADVNDMQPPLSGAVWPRRFSA